MKPGVIEGFYGKTWSWQARHDMVAFLSANGFGSYVYAPKADDTLRKNWHLDWPEDHFNALKDLRGDCFDQGVGFGVALSPVSLVDEWKPKTADQLFSRIESIHALAPEIFSLLFDDIRGDKSGLADIQLEIVYQIRQRFEFKQFLLCPTYYSADPILEELFGPMPDQYLEDLGRDLPENVGIFWTGDKVISTDYDLVSLECVAQRLKRKPVIWDNSFVNDGRKTSPFLPVQAVVEVEKLESYVSGIFFNPMNAPYLAQFCLKTATLSGDDDSRLKLALELIAKNHSISFYDNIHLFREVGLDKLDEEQKDRLNHLFSKIKTSYAADVLDWLNGQFVFDPDCLT